MVTVMTMMFAAATCPCRREGVRHPSCGDGGASIWDGDLVRGIHGLIKATGEQPEARRREHDRATVTLLASTPDALAMPAATAPSTPAVLVNAEQFGTSMAMVPLTFVTVIDPGGNVVFEAVGAAVVGEAVVGAAELMEVVAAEVAAKVELVAVAEDNLVEVVVTVKVAVLTYVVEEVAVIVVVSVMFCAVMFFAVIDPRRANPRHIHIATWPDIPNTSAMDETETKPKD